MDKPKKYPWRVRVKRVVEDVVEIWAETGDWAEYEARTLPGVVSVLKGNTIRGDHRVGDPLAGIEEGET